MSGSNRGALLDDVISTFGSESPEARLTKMAKSGWLYTPSTLASLYSIDIRRALRTLIHLSTPRFPLLHLQVSALDSEGVEIIFSLDAVRDYLEGKGPLLDPRTGEEFKRMNDVRIAFVAEGIEP